MGAGVITTGLQPLALGALEFGVIVLSLAGVVACNLRLLSLEFGQG